MPEPVESCGNCRFFLEVEATTGKGICRINPPREADDRNEAPTKNYLDGRRWPVCWGSEWCGRWSKKT